MLAESTLLLRCCTNKSKLPLFSRKFDRVDDADDVDNDMELISPVFE